VLRFATGAKIVFLSNHVVMDIVTLAPKKWLHFATVAAICGEKNVGAFFNAMNKLIFSVLVNNGTFSA